MNILAAVGLTALQLLGFESPESIQTDGATISQAFSFHGSRSVKLTSLGDIALRTLVAPVDLSGFSAFSFRAYRTDSNGGTVDVVVYLVDSLGRAKVVPVAVGPREIVSEYSFTAADMFDFGCDLADVTQVAVEFGGGGIVYVDEVVAR